MKKVFLFAAVAALFTACSSKDEVVKDDGVQQPQLEKGAIGFDVYTQKATTRAGWTGSLTTELLKLNSDDATPYANSNGFGVFGFYTDNNEYEQRSVPNFMYNQQVTWKDIPGYWEYDPIMYWPNEYGSDATSDDADKVSFFAYAPYVEVVPTSGKISKKGDWTDDNVKDAETWGITGMTRNSNQGDPILKYIASFDNSKSVDLCWGVAPETVWNTTQKGNSMEFKAGLPWLNVQRPAEAAKQETANQRVKFIFKHATAQLQVHIDADVDVDGRGHDNPVANKTRVWVREVKFKGFAMKGSLNLNNDEANKAKWLDYNGQNEIVAEDITIYDGRKDGKEGVNGAVATNEKTLGLNPTLIQDGLYRDSGDKTVNDTGNDVYNNDIDIKVLGVDNTSERNGVTNTAVNLFENTNNTPGNDFFHVIPIDNEKFVVEIVYDIETVDQNLAQNLSDGATKGSSIENRITKEITFGTGEDCLLAGHSYKLDLHLGMYSVKFDAVVTDWIDESKQDVDLPLNVPAFVAKTTPATYAAHEVTLPYTGNYTFAMTGLDGGESVTVSPASPLVKTGYNNWTIDNNNANTSGVAIQTLTTDVNPKTVNRVETITWTGVQSGKGVQMTFTQKAHPLFMTITKMVNNTSNQGEITLTRWNDETHQSSTDWKKTGTGDYNVSGWKANKTGGGAAVLEVWRNGIKLDDSMIADFNDNGTDATNTFKINDKLQNGDVIKVVLTTGDAPTETVTAVFEGLKFVNSTASVQYKPTGTYSVTDLNEIKNNFGTITYGVVPSTNDVADIASDGTITTKGIGKVTVTATDDLNSSTATFELEVTKQNTEVVFTAPTSNPNELDGTNKTAGDDICDITNEIRGKVSANVLAGNVSYTIRANRKNGTTALGSYFTISGGKLKIASSLTVNDVYTITIKANATVTDTEHYNNPSEEAEMVIKYTLHD